MSRKRPETSEHEHGGRFGVPRFFHALSYSFQARDFPTNSVNADMSPK